MKYIVTFFLFSFISVLLAVEISILNETVVTEPTSKELDATKASLIKRHIMITDKEAKKLIKENRILAKVYMEKYGLDDVFKVNMKLEIEKSIANQLIYKIQKDISIDDEILMSYYVANKKKFIKSPMISFEIYKFDRFNEALDIYEKYKDQSKELYAYCKDNNISVDSHQNKLNYLSSTMQQMIKYQELEPPFLLQPQFFIDHFSLIKVISIEKEGYRPFNDKVKKEIRNFLFTQTFRDKRKEIILENMK